MPAIVSLISDQSIPNLLFIREYASLADEFIFITTPLMQSRFKTQYLVQAAGLPPFNCREVTIEDENDLRHMEQVFTEEFPDNHSYLVNITGGTKIMFLAAYNFFRKPGNRIFYLPIGRNIITEMFPASTVTEVKHKLNVREYLQAYGIIYNALQKEQVHEFRLVKKVLKEYKKSGFDINALNSSRDESAKQFFTGGWFEQYIYHLIKQHLDLEGSHIEIGLKINNLPEQHRAGNDNELDLVFTINNELHVIEAKVSMGVKKIKSEVVDRALFKLSALNKNFGLRSHPWIFTLSDFDSESSSFCDDLKRKMKVIGIKGVIDRNKILGKPGLMISLLKNT